HREVLEEDVELKRMIYKSHLQNLVFKNVHITGANSAQQEYIENAIHRSGQKFTLEEFKTSYFKLLADSKISEIIPHAVYNPEEKCFDLNLEVIMDENVIISFGGNISSSNSNQAFLGIGYQSLSKYAINYDLQGNFGDANNSVMLSGRVELPTRSIPMYLRLMGVFMNQKYYNSDNLFYTEDVLAFIRQKDIYVKMRLGFPFLMRGKAEISLGYGELRDYYYQSNNVSFAETDFDKSRYKLGVGTFRIEHNSLNNKMYATEGLSWYMLAQLVAGTEYYKSAPVKLEGGVTEITHEKKDHSWMQIKGVVRNYNTLSSEFNLGYHLESVIAGKNFFNNYTSTVLQASAFQPTPHSKTSFNEKLRANQYFAGGLIPIWKINRLFHLRGEFYAFLPFNEIIRTEDNKASQGKFLRDFQYLGEASLVCQLPFMSIAVFANKYSYPDNNWNFGLNIGYLIFNSRLIEQ
ncbi:MAG: patatin, partial [Candidatus Azobacteroides sp.]|nr:patatin [Candidatus Azobacteroides sp.]